MDYVILQHSGNKRILINIDNIVALEEESGNACSIQFTSNFVNTMSMIVNGSFDEIVAKINEAKTKK